ncbi:hypothetical protein EJB05_50262, partial [Eragrostis curvula]
MELLRDNVPMVSLSVTAAALYARFASSRLPPGLPRFAALLPVIAFFAVAPLAFSSSILRFVAGFFLGWLGTFKVALLAAGRGPLDPALPVVPFLFIAAFPVKLKGSDGGGGRRPAAASEGPLSRAVEVALLAAILRLYPFIHTLHRYVRYCAYGVHLYCLLNLLLPCTAAAGLALAGMELEMQFDRPYLSSSLREFWGRRWNLMVSAILRSAVYDPVRARVGRHARGHGVLPPPAPAHRRDGRLLPHPRRVLPRRGLVRAEVEGQGVAAAAAAGHVSASVGVHGGDHVLARLPADLPGWGRGDAAAGVGGRAGVLCRHRPKPAPVFY